jgi:hypothetical protein
VIPGRDISVQRSAFTSHLPLSPRQPPVRTRAQVELNRLQFRKLVNRKSS